MKCHVLAVISDITREKEVQIQFLSNGNHTLNVQRVAGVWVESWNTIWLAEQLIQIRSVMVVLIAFIVMLRDRPPSSSDTSSSFAFVNSSRTAITRSSCNSASAIIPLVPFSTTAKAPRRRWRSDQVCSWPRTSLHKPPGQRRHHALQGRSLVHGLGIGLRDFLFAVILAHDILRHLLTHRN